MTTSTIPDLSDIPDPDGLLSYLPESPSPADISSRILQLRKGQLMTQTEFAERINNTMRGVQQLETGKHVPTGNTLYACIRAGFSANFILAAVGPIEADPRHKPAMPVVDCNQKLLEIAINAALSAMPLATTEEQAKTAASIYQSLAHANK